MTVMYLDANIIGKPAFGEHQIHDQWLETHNSCIQFHTSNLYIRSANRVGRLHSTA